MAGNIGTPPISFLSKLTAVDLVVLELSSFQLQDLEKSPHIAVVLDIKSDHLDYHKNEQEYREAKQNIVKHQTSSDFAVINADYLTGFEFGAATQAQVYWFSRRKSVDAGCFVLRNHFVLRTQSQDIPICQTDEVLLRGEHNFENIAAAIITSYLAGADIESIRSTVKSFKGLEHRLEFVAEWRGISFYNDSFSTTPDTTIAAIKSFPHNPIILLVGGSEKNADYRELGEVISQSNIKTIIGLGQTAERIIQTINRPKSIDIIPNVQSMTEAIESAVSCATAGDVVLLSPASASFDRYKNYKDRGNQFKKIVYEKIKT